MQQGQVKYSNSADFRQQQHDRLDTLFSDGLADELDSSMVSMHFDDGPPNLRLVDGTIWLYHGDSKVEALDKISKLTTDDRALGASGHIRLDSGAPRLYKVFAEALHNKMFRLTGIFDCANAFIKNGMSRGTYERLPVMTCDTFYPYLFRDTSPIKGQITFDRVLPANDANPHRRVICINVSTEGNLTAHIPHGTMVYLGGDHDKRDLQVSADGTPSTTSEEESAKKKRKASKYVHYNEESYFARPGSVEENPVLISSPFENTWGGREEGLNIALAKLSNSHFIYWGTWCSPLPGRQMSKLPLQDIPSAGLLGLHLNEHLSLMTNPQLSLEEVFDGAWVMRGDSLVDLEDSSIYPAGVLERMRGGFFRPCDTVVRASVSSLFSRLSRAMKTFARLGAGVFGFEENDQGIIECTIEQLAEYFRLPPEGLLAFMCQVAEPERFFQGTVAFLGEKNTDAKFKIVNPAPVGPWMKGSIMQTGCGLLYTKSNKKYFSVETKNGVSLLTEYTGPGILNRSEVCLGEFIASA